MNASLSRYYSNVNCVHVPAGLGQTQVTFDISLRSCGMNSNVNDGAFGTPTPQGSFIENTIIIQYDPQLQEVWDQARKLRCTWYVTASGQPRLWLTGLAN